MTIDRQHFNTPTDFSLLNIICILLVFFSDSITTSSTFIINKIGLNTPPSRKPSFIINFPDYVLSHQRFPLLLLDGLLIVLIRSGLMFLLCKLVQISIFRDFALGWRCNLECYVDFVFPPYLCLLLSLIFYLK